MTRTPLTGPSVWTGAELAAFTYDDDGSQTHIVFFGAGLSVITRSRSLGHHWRSTSQSHCSAKHRL